MSNQTKTKTIQTMMVTVVFLLILNIIWTFFNYRYKPSDTAAAQRSKYPLLSRHILTDSPNDILINFVPLRKKLETKFSSLDVQKSFYFEYLPDGTSVKIGDDKELVAASLIKLPLVMNLYRAAELKRIDLDKKVAITSAELDGGFGDLYKKGPGTVLTLREAAQLALTQSDNTAAHVIYDAVQGLLKYDQESLAQLDIDQNMEEGQAVISSKSYSSILKSLYFTAYLSKSDSQEILSYLTQSIATNRLTKFLPKDILVAHKIGVNNANRWSESDCGIVYVPKRPYTICVMVGLHEHEADDFIASVSKDVYDFVISQP